MATIWYGWGNIAKVKFSLKYSHTDDRKRNQKWWKEYIYTIYEHDEKLEVACFLLCLSSQMYCSSSSAAASIALSKSYQLLQAFKYFYPSKPQKIRQVEEGDCFPPTYPLVKWVSNEFWAAQGIICFLGIFTCTQHTKISSSWEFPEVGDKKFRSLKQGYN